MSIKKEEVRYIAKLAHLNLNDQEIETYQKDLSSILKYFDKLKEIDTSNVKPNEHAFGGSQMLREDKVSNSLDIKQTIKNFPEENDGFAVVPKVIN